MKNTKMRKKMLLSSIAMLMVATVSLGSATYAWFTTSLTATAAGLKMKATAAHGLKILSATEANRLDNDTLKAGDPTSYKTDTVLRTADGTDTNASFALTPTSLYAQTNSWSGFTTTADTYADSAAKEGAAVTTASAVVDNATGTGAYYEEKVYCALVGADAGTETDIRVSSLTITPIADYAMAGAVHVALYYHDDSAEENKDTLIGVYSTSGTDTRMLKATGTYATATAENFAALEVDLTSAATDKAMGKVDTTGNDYVSVIVYLDGENENVKSSAIKPADLISNISLQLAIANPSA